MRDQRKRQYLSKWNESEYFAALAEEFLHIPNNPEYRDYDCTFTVSLGRVERCGSHRSGNSLGTQHRSHGKISRARDNNVGFLHYARNERESDCKRESGRSHSASAISCERSSRCVRGKDYRDLLPGASSPAFLAERLETPKIILDCRNVQKSSRTGGISRFFSSRFSLSIHSR